MSWMSETRPRPSSYSHYSALHLTENNILMLVSKKSIFYLDKVVTNKCYLPFLLLTSNSRVLTSNSVSDKMASMFIGEVGRESFGPTVNSVSLKKWKSGSITFLQMLEELGIGSVDFLETSEKFKYLDFSHNIVVCN